MSGCRHLVAQILDFLEELHHWNSVTQRRRERHILRLSGAQGNASLELGVPNNWAASILNDISCPGLGCGSIIFTLSNLPIATVICINKHFKRVVFW